MILAEVCELIVDCPHSTAKDEGEGYPLIRTPNIGKGRLLYEGVHRVSKTVYDARNFRAVPQDDDLIFAREAPAGNIAIIKNGKKVCLGQRTVLLRPNKKVVNPDFLVYYLLAPAQQYGLIGTANGATVAHVNIPTIRNLKIKLPPMEIQKKIADILSAYDDLIENNQKQIKLLEEAAQRLYKEWFIDLHFPGYESTPITDGIPQGWKKEKIDDVYDIKYGKTLPTTQISDNGEYPVYGANGVIGYYSHCNYVDYVTLITSRGNGSGDVSRTHHKKAFITNNSFVVSPKEAFQYCKLPFTYLLFFNLDFRAIRTGSAQPQLTNTSISTLNLLMPSKEIVLNFIEKTTAIFEKIEVLHQSISNAIEARNRLLPKLMNGEIEVAMDKKEIGKTDEFEYIRKHWQAVPYDKDLPLAARSTGDISEETLEKLKEIAEEE